MRKAPFGAFCIFAEGGKPGSGAAVIDEKPVHVLADGSPVPIARAVQLLIDATQADPL
jgi:hypothetical protein